MENVWVAIQVLCVVREDCLGCVLLLGLFVARVIALLARCCLLRQMNGEDSRLEFCCPWLRRSISLCARQLYDDVPRYMKTVIAVKIKNMNVDNSHGGTFRTFENDEGGIVRDGRSCSPTRCLDTNIEEIENENQMLQITLVEGRFMVECKDFKGCIDVVKNALAKSTSSSDYDVGVTRYCVLRMHGTSTMEGHLEMNWRTMTLITFCAIGCIVLGRRIIKECKGLLPAIGCCQNKSDGGEGFAVCRPGFVYVLTR